MTDSDPLDMTLREAIQRCNDEWEKHENCTPESHSWGGYSIELNAIVAALSHIDPEESQ